MDQATMNRVAGELLRPVGIPKNLPPTMPVALLSGGVLQVVRNARDSGHSCIFIAHNIRNVFQVVERIVVLRRGTVAADDIDPRRTTIEEVERIITGI